MKLTAQLTPSDLYRMLRHIQLGQNRFIDGVYFIMSLFSLCLVVVMYYLDGWGNPALYLFTLPAILYFFVIPARVKLQAKKLFQKKDVFQRPIEYEFKPEGIFTKNARGSEEIEWERVEKVMETGKEFIFYLGRTKAFTIPKRLFAHDAEERDFEDFLCNHFDPNKVFRN